ncbi:MAG: SusD/RagB family nutrient-binding outer membrane lipoprotein [Lutibacter sp.]|uniref:SusD/RagB family nutrient-binding outer membrane lipoprotein n=1 Tax=Lutibacter sp. TaxID=1925666 RepID=UPI00182ADFD7|nr:SusD/RagB family nutrient-binding outer membrane lipoprotein [Lutibacter sp.]MBT8316251.1 SusD/RagB family nutrient-binding outer membrane lipoprotein [Lutibacter sp.]NNJ57111.1 SusD/RagB family nutrient-binding outer membrane lipoprotein [Lutibacter sp.]
MKKISKLLKLMLFCGVLVLGSCETTELDITQNPNALSPEQANPDFFMNSIQEDFARFVETFGRRGAELTRIDYMAGRDYTSAYSPAGFDGVWTTAYQSMMQDIKVMNTLSVDSGLNYHVGMGQVFQAYTMMTLVDFFGDVPYTEALAGADNLNPTADSGASIYAAAIALLDEAIANFSADALAEPEIDFYYDGDWDKWIKVANTLKMKAYMTTRLVDGSAVSSFNAIVASGDYISSNSDNFEFTWGKNEVQPDTRHPRYSGSYTPTGGDDYMSNSLMDYMTGKNEGAYSDPLNFDIRTLYYFYRQVSATPGQGGAPTNQEALDCSAAFAPVHYVQGDFTYCGVAKGWWGRDHGNNSGIPPDGFLRALAGVYPAGGALDDLTYEGQVNGDGNGGNGITPVMQASWVKFMIAETQMISGATGDAKTSIFEGIDLSIDKVTNFTAKSERFNWIFGTFDGGPALALESDYIDWFKMDLEADWDSGSNEDKMNIMAMQYFVATYGNGIDAYNFYRRTGYPTTLQPNLEPNPGTFIRSFFYPANYANTNSNATQKSGIDVQVFWDTNPASPGFPVSN